MAIVAELLTMARLVDNYAVDATGGGSWSTNQLYKVTVPAGKRWFFIAGSIQRSDASTIAATIRNDADKIVYQLDDYASATTICAVPSSTANQVNTCRMGTLLPMDAGWYFNLSFGTAQGATAWAVMAVLEIDVE